MEQVDMYRGSVLVQVIECASLRLAWDIAVSCVRAAAHQERCAAPDTFSAPAGRVSYQRGQYRCVTARKVRA